MAGKVDIFIPIYIGDYLADTQDLTAEEHGAYLLILFTMWRTRVPVLFDRLAWVAKVDPARWAAVWGSIGRFFEVSAGMVTQLRLMRELDAALEKKRRKSDAGTKSGANRRRAKDEQNANRTNADGPTKREPSPSPSKDPDPPPSPLGSVSVPDRAHAHSINGAGVAPFRAARMPMPWDATVPFLRVFERYPNGNAKGKAACLWQAIAETVEGGEIALEQAIAARFDDGMLKRHPYTGEARFRPTFETFLAERRWEDPDSAPDDIAPTKVAETFEQRDARARKESGERRNRELADIERKTREADAAVAVRLATPGGPT